MNEIGFNREYAALRLCYGVLKERVASQLEQLHMLVSTKGPNLKARYMMFIGRLEYRVYELKVDIRRWRRRFALRQAALNKGEKPDLAAIETTLKRELAEFLKEIRIHAEEIESDARLFSMKKLSDKEDAAVRAAYLNAVKKLHPDLNPDLPKAAQDLWHEIQAAYAMNDWDAVKFLAELADGVVDGAADFSSAPDAMAALRNACEGFEAKRREVEAEMERIQKKAPFTYEAFLADEAMVVERQNELKATIVRLKAKIRKYEEEWGNG